MLKENKRTLIITSIVILLPILIGLILWNRFPDSMAVHFGVDNEANGYGSKFFAVFGLPLISLAIQWFAAFITSRDPRKQNISPKIFNLILWIIPVATLYASVVTYSYNLGYKIDITFISELFIGLLLVIIGNFLPKARHNYTVGIRIPWTMDNETNWNKTHRLGGYLWMGIGLLMIILTLCCVMNAAVLFGGIIVAVAVPMVYSFWLHAKKGL